MARLFGSAALFSRRARSLALLLPLIGAAALVLLPSSAALSTSAWALESGAAVALEPLTIVTDPKGAHPVDHALSVEVMRTEAEREHGLMERPYLPADRGMLFQFDVEQPILMWMKNTLIPLDMIFISRAGVVTHIHENAEPMSEAIISSKGPVFSVLEVNAGYARKIGLKPGDLVRHAIFRP
ncbi:DUF192 domain-containing protein [Rhodoblastus sp.]|uniref:DUF192 domain-containing protein n=1 Tax=Rhodoblastus sp. TaxID=1962975 RepID=UPI0035B1107B